MSKCLFAFSSLATILLISVVSCSRDNLYPDIEMSEQCEGDVVRKVVKAKVGKCNSLFLALTRTTLDYHESATAVPGIHMVKWSEMDRVYSYSQSGAYMFCDLSSSGLTPNFDPANPYEARIEVIYRGGDKWYNAYVKGDSIGDYIGIRTQYSVEFHHGIPHLQDGDFKSTHIAVTTSDPNTSDDVWFTNMQSYLRFRVEGNEGKNPLDPSSKGNAKIGGKEIAKLTIRNYTNEAENRSDDNKEMMAGNVELNMEVKNAWNYSLLRREDEPDCLADTMITVIPKTGIFRNDGEYFVAVPVRKYLKGMMIELYDAGGTRLAYVKTPRAIINYNQIYDCADILQYVIFACTKLDLYYDDSNDPALPSINCVTSTGVDIEEGHSGKLIPSFTPEVTTDKSLVWESSDKTVAEVISDGTLNAKKVGTCKVKAITKGIDAVTGNPIECEIEVRVKEQKGLGAGTISSTDYEGVFAS